MDPHQTASLENCLWGCDGGLLILFDSSLHQKLTLLYCRSSVQQSNDVSIRSRHDMPHQTLVNSLIRGVVGMAHRDSSPDIFSFLRNSSAVAISGGGLRFNVANVTKLLLHLLRFAKTTCPTLKRRVESHHDASYFVSSNSGQRRLILAAVCWRSTDPPPQFTSLGWFNFVDYI